eukprot:GHVR01138887.1.p1 GENE.GHVR01138887.1~~GHVR01138887.1.p1  ORF type:complete len:145 (+),score=40.70 GHVR01138887.1:26-436(+)
MISDEVASSFQSDFARILDIRRQQCEEMGDFPEASVAREKLRKLRLLHEQRLLTELDERQKAETLVLKEQRDRAFVEFNNDRHKTRKAQLKKQQLELIKALQDKHVADLHKFDSSFVARTFRPKVSSHVIMLKQRR